jgi:hypothetical protein
LFDRKKPSFFKRKGMPTPDASQFTQMKKFHAIERRVPVVSDKINTHLYQPVPSASGLTDFLPSFTNKYVSPTSYTPINVVTGEQAKRKFPARGKSCGGNPGNC